MSVRMKLGKEIIYETCEYPNLHGYKYALVMVIVWCEDAAISVSGVDVAVALLLCSDRFAATVRLTVMTTDKNGYGCSGEVVGFARTQTCLLIKGGA